MIKGQIIRICLKSLKSMNDVTAIADDFLPKYKIIKKLDNEGGGEGGQNCPKESDSME